MADFNTRAAQTDVKGRDGGREGRDQRNAKVGKVGGAELVRQNPRLVRDSP